MHKILNRKIIKFFITGLFNTCVTLLLIYFLTGLLHVNIILSSSFSFMISNIFSYYINSKYIFYKEIKINYYLRFLSASLLSFSINFFLNTLFFILNFHYLLATFLCLVLIPGMTFYAHNKWTWKK